MFDPVSLGIAGGSAILSLIQGQQAKKQAEKQLAAQQAMAAEQLRFAKSSRTDAYGNRVYYDDATGGWQTQLDPYQDRIIKAGEHEQLLGLTKDAGQNRAVRERAYARGQQADEDYNRTRADYLYGAQPSEGASEDRLARLMSLASGSGGSADANQQLRQKGNVAVVRQGGNGSSSGDGIGALAKILMQARQGAISETGSRSSARNNKYLPALQSFERTAGGGGGAPIKYSDTPGDINSQYGDMSKLISGAYTSGARNIGSAYKDLTTATGKQFPSIGDSVKMAALLKGDTKTATKEAPRYFGGSPETNEWLNPSTYNYGV